MYSNFTNAFDEFRPTLFDKQKEATVDDVTKTAETSCEQLIMYTANEISIIRQESFAEGSNAEKSSRDLLRTESLKDLWENLQISLKESIATQESAVHSACQGIALVIFETLCALLPSVSDRMVRQEVLDAVQTLLTSAGTETCLTVCVSPLLHADISEALDQFPPHLDKRLVLSLNNNLSEADVIFEWCGGVANHSSARIRTFIGEIFEDMILLRHT